MSQTNRQWIHRLAPGEGEPKPDNFRLETGPVPEPGPGQVLLRNRWLSLDPYMRGRMSTARSYAKPLEIGDVMVGGTVSEVVASQHPEFKAGDLVLSYAGWQDYALSDGTGLRKLDPERRPRHHGARRSRHAGHDGLYGPPQHRPAEGGRDPGGRRGCPDRSGRRSARSRSSRAAAPWASRAAPTSAATSSRNSASMPAVDHRAPDFAAQLKAACPDGIDIYFENVGGAVWDAVFPLLNDFARVPVCGLVALYNATSPPEGPDRTPSLMRAILTRRLTLRGFIVGDFAAQAREFARDMGEWVQAGRIRYREDVAEGLENAPDAFIGMLKGRNFGKTLVKL